MRRVLLTRAIEQSAASAYKLQLLGWSTVSLPLYQIELLPIPNLHAKYNGLIITSQNAIAAAQQLAIEQQLPLHCYVVGEQSASKLRNFSTEAAVTYHTASLLVQALLKKAVNNSLEQPLLYLRGEEVKLDIKGILLRAGLQCDEVVVYKTIARHDLPASKLAQVEAALFYSHKNSKLFAMLAQANPGVIALLPNITAIAISEDAAMPLRSMPFAEVLVSKQPNEKAILQTLMAIKH